MLHTLAVSAAVITSASILVFLILAAFGMLGKIIEALQGIIAAIHVQTHSFTNPREGLTLAPHELAILSRLLRGYVVGPSARAVLDKVHMFGEQGSEVVGPVN